VIRRAKKLPIRSPRNKATDVDKSAPNSDALPPAIGHDKVFHVAALETIENKHLYSEEAHRDERLEQVSERIFQPIDEPKGELIPAAVFDEAGYLRLNPDIRHAIALGQFESGYSHYVLYGHAEGRRSPKVLTEARNVMLPSVGSEPAEVASIQPSCAVEALLIAPSGGLMVVGWIDDVTHPISCIRIISSNWRVVLDASRLVRQRRIDVEKAIGSRAPHSLGFFGFLHFDPGAEVSAALKVELWQQGGNSLALNCAATIVGDVHLRNTALGYLASASFVGNREIEVMGYLGHGVGAELVHFNKTITRRLVAAPYVERFGPQHRSPRGTIIVCLYGKSEFYFVQNCLFGGLPGIEDYEFIFVSNSPELAEVLLREAHSASYIYGLPNSVMILADNAGFGGANNAAARIARSNRLLIVNPDVFPRDRDWAEKHTKLLDSDMRERTRLFGVPLYYDNGSLMHGGMYFETDVGLAMASGIPRAQKICRVEHYGKGAPPESPQFTQPRPVPAVTGAFLSIESGWFEQLGGFTEDFIFGHYEDADLCLKSIEKGVVPWLQNISMWHLEGKGSAREIEHEGGSLVNRWLFSQTWVRTIEAGLKGPTPEHPLLHSSSLPLSLAADIETTKPKSVRRRRRFR
jgi:GT2 family glycosyltransferase